MLTHQLSQGFAGAVEVIAVSATRNRMQRDDPVGRKLFDQLNKNLRFRFAGRLLCASALSVPTVLTNVLHDPMKVAVPPRAALASRSAARSCAVRLRNRQRSRRPSGGRAVTRNDK